MITRLAVAMAFLAAATIVAVARAADTFKIDPVHSTITFKISHLDISNLQGRFSAPTGTITLDPADPAKTTIDASVKAESVDTANAKRDEDLKGPDFFNVKQYPTISFKSTAAKKVDDKTLEVTGDLTLHGVTKAIAIKLVKLGEADTRMGHRAGFETTFTIKRSDFGMKTMPGLVGDDVTLTVCLEAIKQ